MIVFDLEYMPETSPLGDKAPGRPDLTNIYCEIFQIGAVKLDKNGDEIDSLNVILKPEKFPKLPVWLSEMTRVSDAQRERGISIREGLERLREFIGKEEDVWVFYGDSIVIPNAMKELGFWIEFPEMKRAKDYMDEWGLSKAKFEERGLEYCSGNMSKVLGVEEDNEGGEHDALYDARSMAKAIFVSINKK